jgi:hypothetical protein
LPENKREHPMTDVCVQLETIKGLDEAVMSSQIIVDPTEIDDNGFVS